MFRFALAAYGLLLPFPSFSITRAPGFPPAPRNGEELLSLMRDRYAGKWYRTLTFTQKTTLPDGKIETWYEALELPGKLRIDIAPLDSGKTLLFRNDSLYVFDQTANEVEALCVDPELGADGVSRCGSHDVGRASPPGPSGAVSTGRTSIREASQRFPSPVPGRRRTRAPSVGVPAAVRPSASSGNPRRKTQR